VLACVDPGPRMPRPGTRPSLAALSVPRACRSCLVAVVVRRHNASELTRATRTHERNTRGRLAPPAFRLSPPSALHTRPCLNTGEHWRALGIADGCPEPPVPRVSARVSRVSRRPSAAGHTCGRCTYRRRTPPQRTSVASSPAPACYHPAAR